MAEMKLTVQFGSTAIVVPCGDGSLTVQDLVSKSVEKYKRIGLKTAESVVNVHYLKSLKSNGILDPNDCVASVVDDREQIVAVYDEDASSPSATRVFSQSRASTTSSVGTSSPDLYPHRQPPSPGMPLVTTPTSAPALPGSPAIARSTVFTSSADSGVVADVARRCRPAGPSTSTPRVVEQNAKQRWSTQPNLSMDEDGGEAAGDGEKATKVSFMNGSLPRDFSATPSAAFVRNSHRKSRITDDVLETAERIGEEYWQRKLESDSHGGKVPLSPLASVENDQCDSAADESATRSKPTPSSGVMAESLQRANTRRLGTRIPIHLVKGADGLGFIVTSRDNASGGECLIYVKDVLPRGAAIVDGRLRTGDRILEIDNTEVSGMSQQDVVQLLRGVRVNQTVELVVSRQEAVPETASPPPLPRQLPPEPLDEKKDERVAHSSNFASTSAVYERLMFEIPLSYTGSAGLGLSVKGKTCTEQGMTRDLGIFVKSIMHGGAAHKDGRLRMNDQLIAINDEELGCYANEDAMNALRRIMQNIGASAPSIRLTILRPRTQARRSSTFDDASVEFPLDASSALRTAFFVPGYGEYAVVLKAPKDGDVEIVDDDDGYYATVAPTKGVPPPVPPKTGDEEVFLGGNYETIAAVKQNGLEEDGFVRDGPGRLSMSEKRHGAAKMDPAQTATYQRIKHGRQTSAPVESTLVTDRTLAQSQLKMVDGEDHLRQQTEGTARRSMSEESLSMPPKKSDKRQAPLAPHAVPRSSSADKQPLIHELPTMMNGSTAPVPRIQMREKKKSGGAQTRGEHPIQRNTNTSFRIAVDKSLPSPEEDVENERAREWNETAVDFDGGYSQQRQEEFVAAFTSANTSMAEMVEGRGRVLSMSAKLEQNEKDRRRSESGSGGFSFKKLFKFGSRKESKKDVREERTMADEEAKIQLEEEKQRIRAEYEKLKRAEQAFHQQQALHEANRSFVDASSSDYAAYRRVKQPSAWRPPESVQPPQRVRRPESQVVGAGNYARYPQAVADHAAANYANVVPQRSADERGPAWYGVVQAPQSQRRQRGEDEAALIYYNKGSLRDYEERRRQQLDDEQRRRAAGASTVADGSGNFVFHNKLYRSLERPYQQQSPMQRPSTQMATGSAPGMSPSTVHQRAQAAAPAGDMSGVAPATRAADVRPSDYLLALGVQRATTTSSGPANQQAAMSSSRSAFTLQQPPAAGSIEKRVLPPPPANALRQNAVGEHSFQRTGSTTMSQPSAHNSSYLRVQQAAQADPPHASAFRRFPSEQGRRPPQPPPGTQRTAFEKFRSPPADGSTRTAIDPSAMRTRTAPTTSTTSEHPRDTRGTICDEQPPIDYNQFLREHRRRLPPAAQTNARQQRPMSDVFDYSLPRQQKRPTAPAQPTRAPTTVDYVREVRGAQQGVTLPSSVYGADGVLTNGATGEYMLVGEGGRIARIVEEDAPDVAPYFGGQKQVPPAIPPKPQQKVAGGVIQHRRNGDI